jgi:hypothetical protein
MSREFLVYFTLSTKTSTRKEDTGATFGACRLRSSETESAFTVKVMRSDGMLRSVRACRKRAYLRTHKSTRKSALSKSKLKEMQQQDCDVYDNAFDSPQKRKLMKSVKEICPGQK